MAMKAFGKIGRQILQRDIGAGHFAALRQHAAVEADDLDGRRTFRDFQRLDRRQMRADPDDDADDGDRRPQAEHRAPIKQPSDAKTPARLRRAAWRRSSRRAACARAAARRHHRRVCVWRMISSAVRRHRRCGPVATGANRASAAASPNSGSLRPPLFFRPHAIRKTPLTPGPPHANVRSLRAGYAKVNAGLGGAAARAKRGSM